jgi:plasmid stabilization system protein ParE
MRQLVIRPAAQADLVSAVRWYVEQRASLGVSFRVAVRSSFSRALEQPQRHRRVHGEVRAIRVQRFPYRVFFIAEPERLVVIAVLHVRRKPVVWQRRSSGR